MALQLKIIESLADIPAQAWDALHTSDYPFIQHAFLSALERHGCVSEKYGWLPKHALFYQNNQLVAALPLYEKHNNYGEFVFDHSWAQAWESVGLPYYPKLVCAIPYTPARGERLLIAPEQRPHRKAITTEALELLKTFAANGQYSGLHLLFNDAQTDLSDTLEFTHRHDVQFQWFNQNYTGFDDFLAALKPKKRKNIRQERRAVAEAGITFKVLDGHTATQEDWEEFSLYYQKTFLEKWSTPTLNLAFFMDIAQTIPEKIVLVLAKRDRQSIAGALMFRSDSVLYGRHWGCAQQIKHLHFETCFYQGIDYAIANKLQRFEPGAGGEHKIARGFVPVTMQSSHWLSVNPFVQGIQRFVAEEHKMIHDYTHEVWKTIPYQTTDTLKCIAKSNQNLFSIE